MKKMKQVVNCRSPLTNNDRAVARVIIIPVCFDNNVRLLGRVNSVYILHTHTHIYAPATHHLQQQPTVAGIDSIIPLFIYYIIPVMIYNTVVAEKKEKRKRIIITTTIFFLIMMSLNK